MGGYLVNFSIYTMAMIGLIFFALMIYKKFSGDGILSKKSGFLSVEESINIAPRKNLYVIRAGEERFLIAGDVDKTTLISKLNEGEEKSSIRTRELQQHVQHRTDVEELPNITSFRSGMRNNSQADVLRNMVRKINQ